MSPHVYATHLSDNHDDEVLPVVELQQKLVKVNQDVLPRVPTRRPTLLVSSPAPPLEYFALLSPDLGMSRRALTRMPTISSSRRPTSRKVKEGSEIFKESPNLTSSSNEEVQVQLIDSDVEEGVPFEAPMERVRKATPIVQALQDIVALPTSLMWSSEMNNDDVKDERPIAMRAATRQPTRRSIVCEPEPEQVFETPVTRMQQSTLQMTHDSVKSSSPAAEEDIGLNISRQSSWWIEPEALANPGGEKSPEVSGMQMHQSMVQKSCRPSPRSPLSIPKVEAESPTLTSASTSQPTRRPTEAATTPIEKAETVIPALCVKESESIAPPSTTEPEYVETQTRMPIPIENDELARDCVQEGEQVEFVLPLENLRGVTTAHGSSADDLPEGFVAVGRSERVGRAPRLSQQGSALEGYQVERAPTFGSSRNQAPTLARRDAETLHLELQKVKRQKTQLSSKVDEYHSEALKLPLSPIELEKKASTAAPGIVAPPPQLIQQDRKRTEATRRSRKKTFSYSTGRQFPPAPAYPVRDTPAWAKPDTQAPLQQPKAEPALKKRGFFGQCSKWRGKSKSTQRPVPESKHHELESPVRRPPEPCRNESNGTFRYAAPGVVPVPSKGATGYRSQVKCRCGRACCCRLVCATYGKVLLQWY